MIILPRVIILHFQHSFYCCLLATWPWVFICGVQVFHIFHSLFELIPEVVLWITFHAISPINNTIICSNNFDSRPGWIGHILIIASVCFPYCGFRVPRKMKGKQHWRGQGRLWVYPPPWRTQWGRQDCMRWIPTYPANKAQSHTPGRLLRGL